MDSREWTETGDLWSPRGIHGHTIVWTADMRPVEHGHTALWTAYTVGPVDIAWSMPAGPGYLSPCGAAQEPRLGDLTAADGNYETARTPISIQRYVP